MCTIHWKYEVASLDFEIQLSKRAKSFCNLSVVDRLVAKEGIGLYLFDKNSHFARVWVKGWELKLVLEQQEQGLMYIFFFFFLHFFKKPSLNGEK